MVTSWIRSIASLALAFAASIALASERTVEIRYEGLIDGTLYSAPAAVRELIRVGDVFTVGMVLAIEDNDARVISGEVILGDVSAQVLAVTKCCLSNQTMSEVRVRFEDIGEMLGRKDESLEALYFRLPSSNWSDTLETLFFRVEGASTQRAQFQAAQRRPSVESYYYFVSKQGLLNVSEQVLPPALDVTVGDRTVGSDRFDLMATESLTIQASNVEGDDALIAISGGLDDYALKSLDVNRWSLSFNPSSSVKEEIVQQITVEIIDPATNLSSSRVLDLKVVPVIPFKLICNQGNCQSR